MKMLQKVIETKNIKTAKMSLISRTIKGIALCLLISFSTSSAQAQELEIIPTAGYFWGGTLRTYYGDLKLGNGASYGLTMNYSIAPGTLFQAFWSLSSTTAEYYEYGFSDATEQYDLNTNYIHLGVVQEMNNGEAFRPYGMFTMGTTLFNSDQFNTIWQFSLGLGGGLKYYFSDRIGFQVQGRFLLPVYWTGGSWYGGYGYSGGTAIAQGDVTGGIVIVLR